jgi:hypothetical protein
LNDDDPTVRFGRELREFEARFTRYVEMICTNDLLTKFLGELRVAPPINQHGADACRVHFEKLRLLMTQIEEKMPVTQPLLQVDTGVAKLAFALDSFAKALGGPQKGPATKYEAELRAVSERWAAIQELRKGQSADRLDEQLRRINETLTEPAAARASAMAEMRAVQSRMASIRQERSSASQQDREELDAEFEALMEQQSGLIERISSI